MSLRDRFLASKSRPEKVITVDLIGDDGALMPTPVLVLCPTIKQRNAMSGDATDRAGVKNDVFMARAIIECCRDPETKLPVFEQTDADLILDCPSGGWADAIIEAVGEVMAKAEKVAKSDFPPSAPNSL